MRLTVVVPCRDEAPNVARFPAELFPALDALRLEYEVVAVDDGSADGTADALEALRRPELCVLRRPPRGLGAALRDGFAAARGAWTAALDADLTFPPSRLRDLLDAQRFSAADCVCGSPFLAPEGEAAPRRVASSRLLNRAYALLSGADLTAFTPIFRLYRTQALRALTLRADGFEINAEILLGLLAAGARVVEVPAPLGARRLGVSRLSLRRDLPRHLRLLARAGA